MSDDDSTAVRKLYDELLAAWNRQDAATFAAFFGNDGVSIGFDGSTAVGPDVLEHLAGIFADHETATYVAKVREVRPLGPTAALLRSIVGMIPPGDDDLKPDVNALQTLVVVRQDDGWRIALLQNTPAQYHGHPELVEQHTDELRDRLRR